MGEPQQPCVFKVLCKNRTISPPPPSYSPCQTQGRSDCTNAAFLQIPKADNKTFCILPFFFFLFKMPVVCCAKGVLIYSTNTRPEHKHEEPVPQALLAAFQ